jgi:hypothetical protein
MEGRRPDHLASGSLSVEMTASKGKHLTGRVVLDLPPSGTSDITSTESI